MASWYSGMKLKLLFITYKTLWDPPLQPPPTLLLLLQPHQPPSCPRAFALAVFPALLALPSAVYMDNSFQVSTQTISFQKGLLARTTLSPEIVVTSPVFFFFFHPWPLSQSVFVKNHSFKKKKTICLLSLQSKFH